MCSASLNVNKILKINKYSDRFPDIKKYPARILGIRYLASDVINRDGAAAILR